MEIPAPRYLGPLGPGITIRAQIKQYTSIHFITYEGMWTNNMWSYEEIHTHYFTHDSLLLPFELYQEIKQRPYPPNTLPEFQLKDGMEASYTLGMDGEVDGGVEPH
jgi:hypothetical protein